MIQETIQNYINKQQLFDKNNRLLLAVSGGADSMAMLYLLTELGYTCEVAHVNFQLRGQASDDDEALVRAVCEKFHLVLHLKSIDTHAYAQHHKISVEMAARDIRYSFFEDLLNHKALDCVVVAHHRDDVVETFFINMMRGTGLRGLSGIQPKNGHIVRPFLECTHQELIHYLDEKDVPYCVDKTNFDTAILRNKLRHDIIPEMENRKPGFGIIMQGTIARLRASEDVVVAYVNEWKIKHTRQEKKCFYINKEALYQSVSPSELLFRLLQPFKFPVNTLDEIAEKSQWRTGAQFLSSDYVLTVDRDYFIVAPLDAENETFVIADVDGFLDLPLTIKAELLNSDKYEIIKKTQHAYFDRAKIIFPLTLRHWQVGDVFSPFGMKGKQKKLSDYFIDEKIPQPEKENIWLLCSGVEIIWVVAYRSDERFRITDATTEILHLQLG